MYDKVVVVVAAAERIAFVHDLTSNCLYTRAAVVARDSARFLCCCYFVTIIFFNSVLLNVEEVELTVGFDDELNSTVCFGRVDAVEK